jgi:hypothetical protein
MRTTVTLDDDLAIRLERQRAERGASFREVLNEAVRRGLAAEDESARAPAAACTQPLAMGRRLVEHIDRVTEALAIAEGEAFR